MNLFKEKIVIKALKIIDSCISKEHLKNASKFILLYKNKYGENDHGFSVLKKYLLQKEKNIFKK